VHRTDVADHVVCTDATVASDVRHTGYTTVDPDVAPAHLVAVDDYDHDVVAYVDHDESTADDDRYDGRTVHDEHYRRDGEVGR
jgi:hypothetical protein